MQQLRLFTLLLLLSLPLRTYRRRRKLLPQAEQQRLCSSSSRAVRVLR